MKQKKDKMMITGKPGDGYVNALMRDKPAMHAIEVRMLQKIANDYKSGKKFLSCFLWCTRRFCFFTHAQSPSFH